MVSMLLLEVLLAHAEVLRLPPRKFFLTTLHGYAARFLHVRVSHAGYSETSKLAVDKSSAVRRLACALASSCLSILIHVHGVFSISSLDGEALRTLLGGRIVIEILAVVPVQ